MLRKLTRVLGGSWGLSKYADNPYKPNSNPNYSPLLTYFTKAPLTLQVGYKFLCAVASYWKPCSLTRQRTMGLSTSRTLDFPPTTAIAAAMLLLQLLLNLEPWSPRTAPAQLTSPSAPILLFAKFGASLAADKRASKLLPGKATAV